MKIVFWGTPKYAADNLISIVNAGYEVISVVTQPDRKRGRGKHLSPSPVKKVASDLGIPVLSTKSIKKDLKTKNLLHSLKADIYIVVAFGQILPNEILNQPSLGCWNSHASLLPAWRGAAPIQWSLINGDDKTGVCIMAMEEGLDTGPVIEMQSTNILETDNLDILTNRLSEISSRLLIKSIEKLKQTKGLNHYERLNKLKAIDQLDFKVKPSYARQIKKEDFLIDWKQNAIKIIKKIKGLYPNAYTIYNGKRIKLLKVSILNKDNLSIDFPNLTNKEHQITPGQIVMITNQIGIIVKAKDKFVVIQDGQLEGKNKTDGYRLSVQTNLSINNIFGN